MEDGNAEGRSVSSGPSKEGRTVVTMVDGGADGILVGRRDGAGVVGGSNMVGSSDGPVDGVLDGRRDGATVIAKGETVGSKDTLEAGPADGEGTFLSSSVGATTQKQVASVSSSSTGPVLNSTCNV